MSNSKNEELETLKFDLFSLEERFQKTKTKKNNFKNKTVEAEREMEMYKEKCN